LLHAIFHNEQEGILYRDKAFNEQAEMLRMWIFPWE